MPKILWTMNPTTEKYRFMFLPSLKRTFDIFCIHLKPH
jgi:hypothetical protein